MVFMVQVSLISTVLLRSAWRRARQAHGATSWQWGETLEPEPHPQPRVSGGLLDKLKLELDQLPQASQVAHSGLVPLREEPEEVEWVAVRARPMRFAIGNVEQKQQACKLMYPPPHPWESLHRKHRPRMLPNNPNVTSQPAAREVDGASFPAAVSSEELCARHHSTTATIPSSSPPRVHVVPLELPPPAKQAHLAAPKQRNVRSGRVAANRAGKQIDDTSAAGVPGGLDASCASPRLMWASFDRQQAALRTQGQVRRDSAGERMKQHKAQMSAAGGCCGDWFNRSLIGGNPPADGAFDASSRSGLSCVCIAFPA